MRGAYLNLPLRCGLPNLHLDNNRNGKEVHVLDFSDVDFIRKSALDL